MYVLIIDSLGICPNKRHRVINNKLYIFTVSWNAGCILAHKWFQNFPPFLLSETQILDVATDLLAEGLGFGGFVICFLTRLDDTDTGKHSEQVPEQLFLPSFLFF